LLGLLWGCGPDNPLERKAISGTVTLNAAPLEQGSISFEPQQKGGVSSGAVIAKGYYQIEAVKGLPVGDYLVRIHSSKGGDAPASDAPPGPTTKRSAPEVVPPEYNTNSRQVVKVTADGPNNFSFDIRTK
jgi:hypothetical protein